MGGWVVADPSSGIVLGSTKFLTDGRLGFSFPVLFSGTVHGLLTTDPSSGKVQGEGGGGELFITDTDPSSCIVQGGEER